MHFSSVQVLLLAVVAITSIPRPVRGQAALVTCTDADAGKQFCSNCKTPSKCVLGNTTPVPLTTCKTGEACLVLLAKYAVCKPIAETPCVCGTKPAKCDPYDPHSLLVCLSGGITTNQTCQSATNPTGTCIADKCGTAEPQTTTVSLDDLCVDAGTGFIAVTPECTTAAYCDQTVSAGTTVPCVAGQYYDVDESECRSSPPLPCPVSCGTGTCNDKANCTKWYICDVGTVLSEETCDAATPEFDTKTSECVAEGSGTCSKNTGCNFNPITTLTSTQTSTTTSSSTTSTKTSTTTPTTSSSTTSTKTITTPTTTSSTTTSTTTTTTPTTTKTTTTPPTTSSTTTSTTTTTKPPTTSSTTTSTGGSSISTVRPSTCGAANVNIRYPVAGNCKMYSSCRLVGTNVYAYVDSTCLGTLVFNPKTSYCESLDTVPGCVPPA